MRKLLKFTSFVVGVASVALMFYIAVDIMLNRITGYFDVDD